MDASQALADLTEISTQIQAALIADENGAVVASTVADDAAAAQAATVALDLLAAAEEAARGGVALTQILVATDAGSVFVVRRDERIATATTGPEPTVGLVFYDLKTCLRLSAEEPEKPEKAKRSTRSKKTEETADA